MSFDLQPWLVGQLLTLRPLEASDFESLWEVSKDPLIWDQHPDKTRCDREGFGRFFDGAMESGAAFAVIENASGQVIGSTRYYDWNPAEKEIAVGYTFLARRFWGGEFNREMKKLVIEHALRQVEVVWFHVAVMNMRSRRAMEKQGAVLSHHGPRPQNGVMVDFCYYRIDHASWGG